MSSYDDDQKMMRLAAAAGKNPVCWALDRREELLREAELSGSTRKACEALDRGEAVVTAAKTHKALMEAFPGYQGG